MRVVFMGTAGFGLPTLEIIHKSQTFELAGVVTAVDKYGGRGRKQLLQSPVKEYALANDLPLLQPTNLKDESFLSALGGWKADIFVVVAFRMLPRAVWSMPPMGTINLHGSLLPKYRGAAPINWAIINGESESGVTTFFIDDQIDTGSILLNEKVTIAPIDTAGTLHDKLMPVGAKLVMDTLVGLKNKTIKPKKQEEAEVTHAPKLFKHNTEIDLSKSSEAVINFIRGLNPYPGAWLSIGDTEMKIFAAKHTDAPPDWHNKSYTSPVILQDKTTILLKTQNGFIEIIEGQLAGKRRMSGRDIANGNQTLFEETLES